MVLAAQPSEVGGGGKENGVPVGAGHFAASGTMALSYRAELAFDNERNFAT
jgi:hypothetical protein